MRWPFDLSPLEHGAFVFVGLVVYLLVTRIGEQHRHPSAAIAWVLFIALVPYLGTPLFLVFGTRKLVRPPRVFRPATAVDASQGAAWALQLLAAVGAPPPTRNRSVEFDGEGAAARQSLLALIDGARERLDLCTYRLAGDALGTAVAQALAGSARRGVSVRVLVDAIGGLRSSRQLVSELRASGVDLRWFMPVLRNPVRGRTNLRNHRKLAVADGEALWSGGRNLSAEYFDDDGQGWIDLSFVARGPIAAHAHAVFEKDWQAARGRVSIREPAIDLYRPPGGDVIAQLVPSGPDRPDDTLYALLLACSWRASTRIVAVTPYFVPDDALLAALCIACRRGVLVELVVPLRSNHPMADWARERPLRALAAAGARIRLHPSMVHAKLVIVDDALALCGSANLDARSLFLNFELMTAFHGSAEIEWLARWSARLSQSSQAYEWRRPSWARDVLEGLARALGFQL